jgi:hypothetical protein
MQRIHFPFRISKACYKKEGIYKHTIQRRLIPLHSPNATYLATIPSATDLKLSQARSGVKPETAGVLMQQGQTSRNPKSQYNPISLHQP